MSRRAKEKRKSKSKIGLIIVILIILIAVGVVIFINKKGNNTSNVSENNTNTIETANQETKVEEKKEEPVTLLEFPDKSEAEREILERYSNNNDYKIIKVGGSKFDGYLIAIYEPQRVHVVASSKIGVEGDYVADMSKNNNALVAINAGGFADENFNGDGGTPLGITISSGNMLTSSQYKNGNSGIVGFNNENKLVLGQMSSEEAKTNGIRDCVSFGPYLIKDGKKQKLTGSGALGPSSRAARTIIGQREDGIVLFLVVDGDRTKGQGATLGEMADIMEHYGAINATNLDGGTSSQMTLHHELINDPTSMNGEHRTRPVSTAFILTSDDSDNGDSTNVK